MDARAANLLRRGDILRYALPLNPHGYTYSTSGTLVHLKPDLPRHGTVDVAAFSIIVFTAIRPRIRRYPTIPSILDTILRDATEYFVLIFSAQFLSLLFLFVAPVRNIPTITGRVVLIEWVLLG